MIGFNIEKTTASYSVYHIIKHIKAALADKGFYSYNPPTKFKEYHLPEPDKTVYIIKEIGSGILFETREKAKAIVDLLFKANTYKKIEHHDSPGNIKFVADIGNTYHITEFKIHSDESLKFWQREKQKADALWKTHYLAVDKFNLDFIIIKDIIKEKMKNIIHNLALSDHSSLNLEEVKTVLEHTLWPEILGLPFDTNSETKWKEAISFLFKRAPVFKKE